MVCYDISKKAILKPTPTIMMQSLSNHFNGLVFYYCHLHVLPSTCFHRERGRTELAEPASVDKQVSQEINLKVS